MDDLIESAKCAIHLDFLEDPRMLPCGHSFCMSCIHTLPPSPGHIICPMCRVKTDCPDRNLLPKNFGLSSVVQMLKQRPVAFAASSSKSNEQMCRTHNEPCKVMCRSCGDILICHVCADSHRSHDAKSVATRAQETAKEHLPCLQKQREGMAKEYQTIEAQITKQKSDAASVFMALRAELQVREQEVMESLRCASVQNWKRLEKMESIKKVETQIRDVLLNGEGRSNLEKFECIRNVTAHVETSRKARAEGLPQPINLDPKAILADIAAEPAKSSALSLSLAGGLSSPKSALARKSSSALSPSAYAPAPKRPASVSSVAQKKAY